MKTIRKILMAAAALFLVLSLTVPAAAVTVHTVRQGEALWQISQTYRTTVAAPAPASASASASANKIKNVNQIDGGQRLNIAQSGTTFYTVRPGDTLWNISQRHNTTVAALLAADTTIVNDHYIEVGQVIRIPGGSGGSGGSIPAASRASASFSASELDLFARLVHAEASGEPFTGQVAVAASVLNRMKSPRYPNTLSGVIHQVAGGIHQYSPVRDGRIRLPAGDSARRAVQEAIRGSDPSLGATGFYNPRKTNNQWVRSRPVTTVIGSHVFFR